jgi:hypothetical protein
MMLSDGDAGGRYLFNRPISALSSPRTTMIAAVFLAMPYASVRARTSA